MFERFHLAAVTLALASSSFALAEFNPPLAIRHATIHPAPGETIEDGTILIDDGRIVAVGADAEVPADAEEIDASGLVIYPGFIDGATHAGITNTEPDEVERARVEDERPDVREGPRTATLEARKRLIYPDRRVEDVYDPAAAGPGDFRAAGFTTALIAPPPAILGGRAAVIEMGDAPLRRSILRTDAAQLSAFVTGLERADIFALFNRPRPPEYPVTTMGAMAAFRQAMLDARWHRDLLGWERRHPNAERTPLDRDLEALWHVLDGETPVAFVANSENEIHRALNMAAEFSLKPIIVGAREGWKAAERLAAEHVPVVVSLKWSEEPKWPEPPKKKDEPVGPPALRPIFDEAWEKQPFEPQRLFDERVRLWKEEVNNARQLAEAGIAFAFSSFELDKTGDVLDRVRTAVENGLTEEAALAALTRNAAVIWGVADQVGTIEPGRWANLTVCDKPIFEKKARVRWVFVEGERFDAALSSGKPAGRFGRGRGGPEGGSPRGEAEEKEAEGDQESPTTTQTAASMPTTSAATTSVTTTSAPADAPEYEVEIEADRKPRFQTRGSLLIRRATLLTVTQGDLVETDLLIEDGRITAIGRGLNPPPGVQAIDLHGYCVMPGIIDCHSHMCSEGGLNEFSLSVTPEVRVRDVVDHEDVGAFRALAGGVTLIHTMHGSANTIGGQNVVLHLKYGRPAGEWRFDPAPQTVKFALGENVKQSNSRTRATRFPNTRMGVEAVVRRAFDAAVEYRSRREDFKRQVAAGEDPRPVRRDLRLDALAAILDGAIWIHSHCYRADEILRLLQTAEDYGIRVAVLQHVLEGYRVIPEMRRHGCGASTFSDWWAYKIEAYDAIPQNAARMAQGGVVATVNSDSPELVRHLNLEAAKSLRFGGLSPNDCLKLTTINGAKQLGIDDYVGSIEPGKLADLAVFDGHPLDTFSRCVLTLIEGEVYFQHPDFEVDEPKTPLAVRTFPAPRGPLDIAPSPGGAYWITGATIHPVDGPDVADSALEIRDGRIARIEPAAGARAPADAAVIDASGLHVYPGLINAYTTIGLSEIGSVAGTIDVRDIGQFQSDLDALSAYNPFASAVAVSRCEGITTALLGPFAGGRRFRTSSGPIAGQAGLVHLSGWSMPEARIASAVGLVVELPSLPVEFPEWITEERKRERIEEHQKSLAALEEFFRHAAQYARTIGSDVRPRRFDEYDRKLRAMVPCLRREKPVFFLADSYKEILEALAFAEKYRLRPVIVGGREAWKLTDRLSEDSIDVIITGTTVYPGGEYEPFDSVYRNADRLSRAGVRFCFALPDATLAKLLGTDAGYAVAYGLPQQRALRAITLSPAEILGIEDRFGSLTGGKAADVIICTDSPLQAANRVVGLFINGEPVELTSRHTELDGLFRRRPAPALPPMPVELRGPPNRNIAEPGSDRADGAG